MLKDQFSSEQIPESVFDDVKDLKITLTDFGDDKM
jgi:hypothetical protein